MSAPSRNERIQGAVLGLLVGDALGVLYEFHAPGTIPPVEQIEYDPPAGFDRAHMLVPIATWSDDGAQALCLLASLLEQGKCDPDDIARRFLDWFDDGYMAVDGYVFDIGNTTRQALEYLRAGVPAVRAGGIDVNSNGNGSLMRVMPLALWHTGSDADLARDAMRQSLVTHAHIRSQLCCALYCLWARRIMEEASDPWSDGVRTLRAIIADDRVAVDELEISIRPDRAPGGTGSGYVVDALHSARWAVEQGSYEAAVKAAISLGRDTDTTACIAGGIAGLRDGIGAIPERWRTELRGRELYEPLVGSLWEKLMDER